MYLITNMDQLALQIILFSTIIPIVLLIFVVLIKMALKKTRHRKQAALPTNEMMDIFGGADNIISVKKELTRVSIELKDLERVDLDRLHALNVGTLIVGNTIKCSSETVAEALSPLLKNEK